MKTLQQSLLDPKGAAERLNVGRGTVYQLIHSGVLPTVNIPGKRGYRIDPADVDRLIKQWNSGSIPGSEDEIQPAQTQENAALSVRSRKPNLRAVCGDKEQWMQPFIRKSARG